MLHVRSGIHGRDASDRLGRSEEQLGLRPETPTNLRIVVGWAGLPQVLRGACVALGNFDGMHRAHQAVISSAAVAARLTERPLGVIRFDPHPVRVFRPDGPPFLLMTAGQQARVLQTLGVDVRYDLPFSAGLASLSEEAFCRDVLVGGLGIRHVSAGFDIRFGKNRSGDADSLRRWGDRLGFGVAIVEAITDEHGKISSSAVREALRRGDVGRANGLLGRPFAIEGRVVAAPTPSQTASVLFDDYLRPLPGLYKVRILTAAGMPVECAADVGRTSLVLNMETCDRDLRGQSVEIEFIGRLD